MCWVPRAAAKDVPIVNEPTLEELQEAAAAAGAAMLLMLFSEDVDLVASNKSHHKSLQRMAWKERKTRMDWMLRRKTPRMRK